MAKRRKKTRQQINRQNEIRNLRRRAKRLTDKISNQFSQPVSLNVNEYLENLKSPLTSKEIKSIRGKKLENLLKRKGLVEINKINVSLVDYQETLKNLNLAKELAKQFNSGITIEPPNNIESLEGFYRYSRGIEKLANVEYWETLNNRYISNFIKSLSALGKGSIGYNLIVERIKEIGIESTVAILRKIQEDKIRYSSAYYFSSDQGNVLKTLSDLFEAFGLVYDPNINYSAKDIKYANTDDEDMTDAELQSKIK